MQGPVAYNNIVANTVVIEGTGGGWFVYNGTGALGNPPIAYSSSATQDPFGNTIIPNEVVSFSNGLRAALGLAQVQLNWDANAQGLGGPASTASGGMVSDAPVTNSDSCALIIQGPSAKPTGIILPIIQMSGQSQDGTKTTFIQVMNSDASNIPFRMGGDIDYSPGGTPEPWHVMTLVNNWINQGGTFTTARYRRISSPPRTVEVDGVINTNGGTVTSRSFFQLPVGYRPSGNGKIFEAGANGSASFFYGLCDNTGVLSIQGTAVTTSLQIFFHGFIPLD